MAGQRSLGTLGATPTQQTGVGTSASVANDPQLAAWFQQHNIDPSKATPLEYATARYQVHGIQPPAGTHVENNAVVQDADVGNWLGSHPWVFALPAAAAGGAYLAGLGGAGAGTAGVMTGPVEAGAAGSGAAGVGTGAAAAGGTGSTLWNIFRNVAPIAGAVGQSLVQSNAAQAASAQQLAAVQAAIAENRRQFDVTQQNVKPFLDLGTGAGKKLSYGLGL